MTIRDILFKREQNNDNQFMLVEIDQQLGAESNRTITISPQLSSSHEQQEESQSSQLQSELPVMSRRNKENQVNGETQKQTKGRQYKRKIKEVDKSAKESTVVERDQQQKRKRRKKAVVADETLASTSENNSSEGNENAAPLAQAINQASSKESKKKPAKSAGERLDQIQRIIEGIRNREVQLFMKLDDIQGRVY